jgi:hypothetical protein
MVLLEREMMELSSLTASVTLATVTVSLSGANLRFTKDSKNTHIKEFGFFFFFRMAVDVSSSCFAVRIIGLTAKGDSVDSS